MSDLISRQAAIDVLNDVSKHYTDKGREWHPHVNFMVDAIKELPSVKPEQRWIPCSERLPEKSGRYLVTRGSNVCGSLWNRVYILNYSDLMGLCKEKVWWSGNVGKSDFEKYDDVIAWQPLPEPYREERTEE